MRNLIIDIANATGNGIFGSEAKGQIPHRQTIQKQAMKFADQLIARAFEELKPFIGRRVHLLVDHGKIVSHYLSMFASFLDNSFELKLIPIGFIPCTEGKSGADTAKAIMERLKSFGWSEEEAKSCAITADGALSKLGDHFASYIRCVSHSVNLLAERVVNPLDEHKALLAPEVLRQLSTARACLQHAQNVSSSIRNNFQAFSELTNLPTLPNDTRWLNGLKCLKDVDDLAPEIQNILSKISSKGRNSMYWISDEMEHVNAVLHILKPLLTYNEIFQKQGEVTIHQVLPAYKVLNARWLMYKNRDFLTIKDKETMNLDLVQALASAGLLALSHYYEQFGDDHYGATLLSPRTKLMTNFSQNERDKAQAFVIDRLPKETASTDVQQVEIPEFLLEISDRREKPLPSGELQRYLDEEFNVKSAETVEEYWRRKRFEYPGLYDVALRVLSIIPSESICESTFSTAGFLLDKRRTRLRTETVERIVIGCQIAAKFPQWVENLK